MFYNINKHNKSFDTGIKLSLLVLFKNTTMLGLLFFKINSYFFTIDFILNLIIKHYKLYIDNQFTCKKIFVNNLNILGTILLYYTIFDINKSIYDLISSNQGLLLLCLCDINRIMQCMPSDIELYPTANLEPGMINFGNIKHIRSISDRIQANIEIFSSLKSKKIDELQTNILDQDLKIDEKIQSLLDSDAGRCLADIHKHELNNLYWRGFNDVKFYDEIDKNIQLVLDSGAGRNGRKVYDKVSIFSDHQDSIMSLLKDHGYDIENLETKQKVLIEQMLSGQHIQDIDLLVKRWESKLASKKRMYLAFDKELKDRLESYCAPTPISMSFYQKSFGFTRDLCGIVFILLILMQLANIMIISTYRVIIFKVILMMMYLLFTIAFPLVISVISQFTPFSDIYEKYISYDLSCWIWEFMVAILMYCAIPSEIPLIAIIISVYMLTEYSYTEDIYKIYSLYITPKNAKQNI